MRHLVEAHGGTVSAESPGEGRGSRFSVLLPVQAVYRARPASSRPPPPVVASSPDHAANLEGLTILVVDDDADSRELVATVLRAEGAEVTAAASAMQALALLEVGAPMLLVSDVGMADVDGYELLRRIRRLSDPKCRNLPAIALTAYSRAQDRRLALAAGFQSHISKPVEPAELVRVAASVVGFVDRQVSPARRAIALRRADTFVKLEKVLETRGLHEALRFLNSRTPHRFTAMYRFDSPTLQNLALVDSHAPDVRKGDDTAMDESYCSIVGATGRTFTTEDTRVDDRLREHPARDTVVSYAGVLLRDEDGQPFGTLCHFDLVPCEVPVQEIPLLEAACPVLMAAWRELAAAT